MKKTDVIRETLKGNNTPYIPYSFWAHVPESDQDPEKLAQATYDMYKRFDSTFIKTMNNGMYTTEDHGAEIDYEDMYKGGVCKLSYTPIENVKDWNKIKYTPITEGALARELKSLEILLSMVGDEAPVVITTFSPLTTANKLCKGKILEHIKEDGQLVKKALDILSNIMFDFSKRAIQLGAAGVFFATQQASYDLTTEELYKEYGVPYDLKALDGASEGWFNIIHMHGDNIMFDILSEYPVQVLNWHAYQSLPDIDEGLSLSDKAVMGGFLPVDVQKDNRNKLRHQVYSSIKESKGKRLILTPACVTRFPYSYETVDYIIECKRKFEKINF